MSEEPQVDPPIVQEHTCALPSREPSTCDACRRLEVELWNAINDYAASVGGDPSEHVHGNTARQRAVATVARAFDQAVSRRRVDDIAIDELARSYDGVAARVCELTAALRATEQDYAHLRGIYAESRDYVATLERERDELVAASRRDVAEINRLDAEVETLKRQVGR